MKGSVAMIPPPRRGTRRCASGRDDMKYSGENVAGKERSPQGLKPINS